jgi:hypothetical protein
MVHEYPVIPLGERPECRLPALSLLNVLRSEWRLLDAFLPVTQRFPTYEIMRVAQRLPDALHRGLPTFPILMF